MNLNVSILPEAIYVNCDTTFYKDSSIQCFNLKVEERRRLPSPFYFSGKRRLGWTIQPNVYMKFHFKHWSMKGQVVRKFGWHRLESVGNGRSEVGFQVAEGEQEES